MEYGHQFSVLNIGEGGISIKIHDTTTQKVGCEENSIKGVFVAIF